MTDLPLSPEFLALQRAVAGRYSVVRELGRGGMGVVFLARDVALDRSVAIKLLPPALAAEPGFRDRFLREARMAASLAHPNIVPIHAVEATDHVVFFVMAYVDGESLGDRIRRRGALPAAEVMRLVQEVAFALSHAHARGIVHRDIKPDNVLLDKESGRAMVTDFGIARAVTQTPAGGVPAGTPHYLSPEVARGEPGDERSDLYALGSLAFFALTGRHPFESATVPALLLRQATEAAPPVGTLVPAAPARFTAAIDRCLARDPAERWQSADAVAAELDRARARTTHIPPEVRAWVREVVPAGNDVALGLTGAASAYLVFTIIAWLEGGTGLAAAIDGMVISLLTVGAVALFGGLALVRFGSVGMAVRDLVEQGYDHRVASAALAQVDAEDAEDARAIPAADRRRRALLYGATGVAKTGLAVWVATLENPEWLALLSSLLAVVIPIGALRAVTRELATGPSLWSRLLRGKLGRFLFRGARLFVRRTDRATRGEGLPTVFALGAEADQLFRALPASARDQLRELPKVLASLRDEATRLRERDDPVAAERLATVAAAMESFRLDLLELAAGNASIPDVTQHIVEASRLGERVDDVMKGRNAEFTPV